MMLIEQTQVPDTALPVAEFRDHLQLGAGFADDGLQNPVLLAHLRAALVAVEASTGKALLPRTYQYVVTAWWDPSRQSLPVAPVSVVQSLTITNLGGGEAVVDVGAYRVEQDTHAPHVVATGWSLPTIPVGGTAEIVFDAGYGAAWADAPADLRQAVLMLAAHYYENRGSAGARTHQIPSGPAAICARYKPIRISGRRWS
ncbi:head-tail connector protein [Rhodobacteraceae bacterium]|nr:head-tail connector protein [Paracoccaceae bacterium]